MNDAMSKTVAMVTAAATAVNHTAKLAETRKIGTYTTGHLYIDDGDGRRAARVTVLDTGRWSLETFRGSHPMREVPELAALRFRR